LRELNEFWGEELKTKDACAVHADRDSRLSSMRCLSAMPGFRASKPRPVHYPKEISTLGDHIRKRRLDLNLLQKQVADQIGVCEITITNWERNATAPAIRHIPAILQFLGHDPLPPTISLPEPLVAVRRRLGLQSAFDSKS